VNAVEVDMDTLLTRINGMGVDGDRLHEDHYIFDNITPYQAFVMGNTLGKITGFKEGVAANDD